MAGEGARFLAANYAQPKPLVPVAGLAMVERAARTLPESDSTIALCRNEIQLTGLRPNTVVVSLPDRTEGQACTCLAAETFIDPLKPVLVAPCDCSLIYEEAAFRHSTQLADCVAFTFRDHPHANRNPQQYSWICTGDSDSVTAVLCKMAPPGNVCDAQGLTGVFWFRQARMLFDAVRRLISSERRINREFYLDSALEILIETGQRVQPLEVRHYVCFGTPDDVRTYEYWDEFFRKCAWHPFGKDTDEVRRSEAFDSTPVL